LVVVAAIVCHPAVHWGIFNHGVSTIVELREVWLGRRIGGEFLHEASHFIILVVNVVFHLLHNWEHETQEYHERNAYGGVVFDSLTEVEFIVVHLNGVHTFFGVLQGLLSNQ
jgi:hypothetical protein